MALGDIFPRGEQEDSHSFWNRWERDIIKAEILTLWEGFREARALGLSKAILKGILYWWLIGYDQGDEAIGNIYFLK